MTDVVQVSTATPSREAAEQLAQSAVQEHLAASAQIVGPAVSVFWHLGEFGTGEEWRLLLITTEARYPALEGHLVKHHPWENPEIAAVPVTQATDAYASWVRETVTPGD
jgi:periplasmic divalent cation tolerance protein